MATVESIVNRQKDGAQFVISARMLRLTPEEFDALVRAWLVDGPPGFVLVGVPHRTVVDGAFFIDRITAAKSTA